MRGARSGDPPPHATVEKASASKTSVDEAATVGLVGNDNIITTFLVRKMPAKAPIATLGYFKYSLTKVVVCG